MTTLSSGARGYVEFRGWSKQDIQDIGVFSEADMVYFPVSAYDGTWIGDVGRNIKRKQYIVRMRCSKWGYFLWKGMEDKVLFLVEGPFDLGWLLKEGFHAAAYLSDGLNPGQIRLIRRFYDKVVFIPDNDAPGRRGADASAVKLRAYGVKVRVFKFEICKDVDELFQLDKKASVAFIDVLKGLEKELLDEEC